MHALSDSLRDPLQRRAAPVVQRAKIATLNVSKERSKAIVAAYVAMSKGAEVSDAHSPDQVLKTLGLSDTWQEVDVPDELLIIIGKFLEESPSFYVPTTTAIWKELLTRVSKRGKLAFPEKIDLSRQKPDELLTEDRRKLLEGVKSQKTKKKVPEELPLKAQRIYDLLVNGTITINFPLDKLFRYRAPQILNGFEVAKKSGEITNNLVGSLGEQRLDAEKRHFGISDELEVNPRFRPRYAALNFKGHRYGAAARNDYGLSHMILSPSIRGACTITIGDSFDAQKTDYGGPFPFTPTGLRALAMAMAFPEYPDDTLTEEGPYTPADTYLEVQIHEDVDIRDHVDRILVSTVEMRLFGLKIKHVDRLIGDLTGGVFVREE